MAAGVSMQPEKLPVLRELLNSSEHATEEMLVRKIWIDVALPFEYITESLIRQLERLEPFGMGNEKPVFAEKCTSVDNIKILGKNRNVISLKVRNKSNYPIEAICFEEADTFLDNLKQKFGGEEVEALLQGRKNNISFNIAYYPEINEYNGYSNIRVVIKRYS